MLLADATADRAGRRPGRGGHRRPRRRRPRASRWPGSGSPRRSPGTTSRAPARPGARRRGPPGPRPPPLHLGLDRGAQGGDDHARERGPAFVDWALRPLRDHAPATGSPGTRRCTSTSRRSTSTRTLAAGAELHLVPAVAAASTRGAPRAFIRDHELTQWFSVPSVLTYMARFDAVAQDDFPALERLLWCGEVLPTPVLAHWMRRLPHVRFTNLYGPTEATIAVELLRRARGARRRVGADAHRACRATARSCWCSRTAAAGGGRRDRRAVHRRRRARPGLLARRGEDARRRSSPTRGPTGERIYRTGDLARVDDDGRRRTSSAAPTRRSRAAATASSSARSRRRCNTVAGVRECAVVGVDTGGFEGTTICCAYSVVEGAELPVAELRKLVAALIPRYMLPAQLGGPRRPPQERQRQDRPAGAARPVPRRAGGDAAHEGGRPMETDARAELRAQVADVVSERAGIDVPDTPRTCSRPVSSTRWRW